MSLLGDSGQYYFLKFNFFRSSKIYGWKILCGQSVFVVNYRFFSRLQSPVQYVPIISGFESSSHLVWRSMLSSETKNQKSSRFPCFTGEYVPSLMYCPLTLGRFWRVRATRAQNQTPLPMCDDRARK